MWCSVDRLHMNNSLGDTPPAALRRTPNCAIRVILVAGELPVAIVRNGSPRPNASMTPGAGDHGAGSCAPNRYQAVPSQRAIRMGNFLGNSKSPTVLRL